jgi:hypothetical protein
MNTSISTLLLITVTLKCHSELPWVMVRSFDNILKIAVRLIISHNIKINKMLLNVKVIYRQKQ